MSDPSIVTPHLALPLALGLGGTFVCVEQDSDEDVLQGVYVLLSTPLGRQIELPTYGYEDQTFGAQGGIDVPSAQAAVEEWQPQARIDVDSSVSTLDELLEYVNIGVDTESDTDA